MGSAEVLGVVCERAIGRKEHKWIKMLAKHNPSELLMGAVITNNFMRLAELLWDIDPKDTWKVARATLRMIKKDHHAFAGSYRSLVLMNQMMTDHPWLAVKLSAEQEELLLTKTQTRPENYDGIVKGIQRGRLMRVACGAESRLGLDKPKL